MKKVLCLGLSMAICFFTFSAYAQVIMKPSKNNGKVMNTPLGNKTSNPAIKSSKKGGVFINHREYNFVEVGKALALNGLKIASKETNATKLSDGTILYTSMNFGVQTKAAGTLGIKEKRKTQPASSKEGWVCTNNLVKVSLSDESFMNASNEQQSANIYPGALYTFENFFNGSFKNETATRNPLRITTSVQGGSGNVFEDVAEPTPDYIKNAVNQLYRRMPAKRNMGSYSSTLYECNSMADQALKINAGGGGYGFSASFGYSNMSSEERRYFIIDCTQEMYSLSASMPTVGVFANTADANKPGMMMMGNVTYGFRVLVSFDTKILTAEQGMKFAAAYSGFGAKADFDIQSLVRESSSETTVKMYIVGGQNDGLLSTTKDDIIGRLNNYFKGATLQNAKPIKYQFRNMNNEVIVSQRSTDFFPEQHCVPAVPDASKVMWKLTLNFNSIVNETDMRETIHLGLMQTVRLKGTATTILPNERNKAGSVPFLIYWGGINIPGTPYEEARTFVRATDPGKTLTWIVPQSDLENNASLELFSQYIAMVSTRIGGQTNERDTKDKLIIPLKDVMTRSLPRSLSINFNNRVFKFMYSLTAEKL